jgi:hypothetical protein
VRQVYQWTTDDDEVAFDAITVSIGSDAEVLEAIGLEPGEPTASVCWPDWHFQGDLVKSSGEGPYSVPDALERAEQLRARWGFPRVVISLQHRSIWRKEWGALADLEGLDELPVS